MVIALLAALARRFRIASIRVNRAKDSSNVYEDIRDSVELRTPNDGGVDASDLCSGANTFRSLSLQKSKRIVSPEEEIQLQRL
ncbi:hypothetical protein Tco_0899346 [Tanacetum coccineum]